MTIVINLKENPSQKIPDDFTGKAIYTGLSVECYKKGKLHREDGLPAVEYRDGFKEYWVEGKRHRIGGAAIEYRYDVKEYWINGKRVIKEAHDLLWNLMKLRERKIKIL